MQIKNSIREITMLNEMKRNLDDKLVKEVGEKIDPGH